MSKKAPKGIKVPKNLHRCRSIPSIYPFESGTAHENTFQVDEKFQKLENGIRFNVESLPKAKVHHLNQQELNRKQLLESIGTEISAYYKEMFNPKQQKPSPTRLEAVSKIEDKLVYTGGDGFFQAAVCAFAQHLPLVISPDDIWTLISYAFAKHVDLHSEELRKNFVKHEGKKRIHIETGGGFKISQIGDPDTGATTEEWESIVFGQFSKEIKQHIGEKLHSQIVADFSTTTPSTRAASEITLMAALKNYFSYGMSTRCGIPEITLLGEEDDWVSMIERVQGLGKLMIKKFSKFWLPKLLPVLEEFVKAFNGNINYSFWQTMVKLRDTGGGSGSYQFISGWIQILFPYLASGKLNETMRDWKNMYFQGPQPHEIPKIMSRAPVDWDYFGTIYDLHFSAGFIGFSQDSEGRLKANIGWYVSHDPPKSPEIEIKLVQDEIESLLKGHEKSLKSGDYEEEDWYDRIQVLISKETKLLKNLGKVDKQKAQLRRNNRPKLKNL